MPPVPLAVPETWPTVPIVNIVDLLAWLESPTALRVVERGPIVFDDSPEPATFAQLLDRPEWHRDAACHEHPLVDFFPDRGHPSPAVAAICRRCLVNTECAEAGSHEQFGIWAGRSARERARLRAAEHQRAA